MFTASNMDAIHDETVCNIFCQHPSCWNSLRRLERGFPHVTTPRLNAEQVEQGLPTQSVLNLLDDYGEDPDDKFPSRFSGRPTHERQKVSKRTSRPPSFLKTRAPNASPASHFFSNHQSVTSFGRKDPMSKVEVQEVFDWSDLQSDWHDTFMAKQYYVWVPTKKKKRARSWQGLKPSSPHLVTARDLTEVMLPKEVAWERQASIKYQPTRNRSPISFRSRSPRHSPQGDRIKPSSFYGKHKLMNLPRDVISHLMEHITESEMKDPSRFSHALVKAMPEISQHNTAVALAYGNVLQQRAALKHDKMDTTLEQRNLDKTKMKVTTLNDNQHFEQLAVPPEAGPKEKTVMRGKVPLPDIVKHRTPTISLGLPAIPPGTRVTRPFTYTGTQVDLTLAAVVTPSMDSTADDRATMSPSPSYKPPGGSTAARELSSRTSQTLGDVSEFQKVTSSMPLSSAGSYRDGVPAGFVRALYNATSDSTGHMPRPPPTTPKSVSIQGPAVSTLESGLGTIQERERNTIARQSAELWDASAPVKSRAGRSVRFAPSRFDITPTPDNSSEQVPSQTATPTPAVPLSFTLPISDFSQSGDLDSLMVIGTKTGELSERTVSPSPRQQHVASGTISPASEPWPDVDEEAYRREGTPTLLQRRSAGSRGRQVSMYDRDNIKSLSVNYDTYSESSALTSLLPKSRGTMSRDASLLVLKEDNMEVYSPAPPPPSPDTGTHDNDEDDLLVSSAPIFPLVPTSSASSNTSSYPLVAPSLAAMAREPSNLTVLEEALESDSDMTISAKPPSNLDDISRINTPASSIRQPSRGGLKSRENSNNDLFRWQPPDVVNGKLVMAEKAVVGVLHEEDSSRESMYKDGEVINRTSTANQQDGTTQNEAPTSENHPDDEVMEGEAVEGDNRVTDTRTTQDEFELTKTTDEQHSNNKQSIMPVETEDGTVLSQDRPTKEVYNEKEMATLQDQTEAVSQNNLHESNDGDKCVDQALDVHQSLDIDRPLDLALKGNTEPMALVKADNADDELDNGLATEAPVNDDGIDTEHIHSTDAEETNKGNSMEVPEGAINTTGIQLDQFDATNEEFEDELLKEYTKLS